MMSKAEKITQALIYSLQTILSTNGYHSDMGQQIYLAQSWFDANRQALPCASVFLEEEECLDIQGDVLKAQLSFHIEVHVKKSDSSQILNIFDDLKRCCLYSSELSQLVSKIHYQGFQTHALEEGRSIISGIFNISTVYVENLKEKT